MTALISTAAARIQLRLTESELENADVAADLAQKVEDATGIVIDYIKNPGHGWTEQTVPSPVRTAILLVLTTIYEYRGGEVDPISPSVKSLLDRLRDRTLA